MPVLDLAKPKALEALRNYRIRYKSEDPEPAILEQVYDSVGGRLAYLNRVAKSKDMLQTCRDIRVMEKTWFLNQCWILGEGMDDDVMDQQKYAVCSQPWVVWMKTKSLTKLLSVCGYGPGESACRPREGYAKSLRRSARPHLAADTAA